MRSRRRLPLIPTQAGDAQPRQAETSAEDTIGTLTFDFSRCIDAAFPGGALRLDLVGKITQLFDEVVSESQPLPARLAKMAEEVRNYVDVLAGRSMPSPGNTSLLFDWRVRALLLLNYWHAVKMVGREAANAELISMVKGLTKGAKGRRPRITLRQVQEAMRLRATEKLSFAQAATRVGLEAKDARSLRTAIKWHFPDEKKSG